jgi:hypothetical protein
MAGAGDTPPTYAWIRRSAYLARKIKGGVDPYLAEQEICRELDRGWLHFRYVGIDGRQYTDNLPPGYSWPDAEFGLDDSVVWPKEVDAPKSDPFAQAFRQIELTVARALGELPAPRKRLELYQLEVWVPAASSQPVTAPTTPTQPETPPAAAPEEPVPMPPLQWLEEKIKQRKPDEIPATFAHRIAPEMQTAAQKGEVTKAWSKGYIENRISELKLWPKPKSK